jgi:hypothetical protein
MKIIPLLLLLTVISAYAWNPPIGICSAEAVKKIDSLHTAYGNGTLTDLNGIKYEVANRMFKAKNGEMVNFGMAINEGWTYKPNLKPQEKLAFDNGKCFLHGFDIYIDENGFGLVNAKTKDKFKRRGRLEKSDGYDYIYVFVPEEEAGDYEFVLSIGSNYNAMQLSSVVNKLDSLAIIVGFADTIGTLKYISRHSMKRTSGDISKADIMTKWSKAKNRFEGYLVTTNANGVSWGEAGIYLKSEDIKSALENSGKLNSLNNAEKLRNFFSNVSLTLNGENCYNDTENSEYKACKVYSDGKCSDKMRVWIGKQLMSVSQVKSDVACEKHGWNKVKYTDSVWRWQCYLNGREMEAGDCKNFKKWD